MAWSPKMRPTTKHIREAVTRGDIMMCLIDMKDQQADIFTKIRKTNKQIYLQNHL